MKIALVCALLLCVMLAAIGVCALIWLPKPLLFRLAFGLLAILSSIAFGAITIEFMKDEW